MKRASSVDEVLQASAQGSANTEKNIISNLGQGDTVLQDKNNSMPVEKLPSSSASKPGRIAHRRKTVHVSKETENQLTDEELVQTLLRRHSFDVLRDSNSDDLDVDEELHLGSIKLTSVSEVFDTHVDTLEGRISPGAKYHVVNRNRPSSAREPSNQRANAVVWEIDLTDVTSTKKKKKQRPASGRYH